MLPKVTGFLATFKFWIAAILVLVPSAYLKGCSDGMDRVNAKLAQQAAKVENVARQASEGATAAKETRDDTFRKQTSELQDAIQTPSHEPVGRNTRAVFERMRVQQQAAGDTPAR